MKNGYSHIFQDLEQINLSDKLSKQPTLELVQLLKEQNCAPRKMELGYFVEKKTLLC
jgi:hypothetical protein